MQSPYSAFLHGVSGGMIVGFGIGLLVSVVTLAVGNNIPIPVGIWLIIIFSLIVGISVIGYDAPQSRLQMIIFQRLKASHPPKE